MSIARKPTPITKETKTKRFIQGPAAASDGKLELQPVLINFDKALLGRIDSTARSMGLNRTAFIVSAAAEKLRSLGA
jgi:hypothetical protein